MPKSVRSRSIIGTLARLEVMRSIVKMESRACGSHSVAHDFARVLILQGRQIEPALICREVGNVGVPDLVRTAGREALIQKVQRRRQGMIGVRRHFEPASLTAAQFHLFSQASHAISAHVPALTLQFPVQPPDSIGFPCFPMRGGGGHLQSLILLSLPGRWALQPCVEAAAGHFQHLGHLNILGTENHGGTGGGPKDRSGEGRA